MISPPENKAGFTLLEVIITIVVAAILGAIIVPYMTDALTKSGMPVNNFKKTLVFDEIMENILADHENSKRHDDTYTLAILQTRIGNEGADQSNGYGDYHVVSNHLIKFVDNQEYPAPGGTADGDENILKVIIRNDLNEILTMLIQ